MKKYKNGKRVLSAAIALALVFSMSVISLADDVLGGGEPTVVFTADRSFAFSDPNDLFDGFKDMMPGDSLSREVTVTSEASGRYYIYLYARDCVLYNDEVNGQGHFEGVDAENTSEILDAVTVTDSQGNVLDLKAAGPAEEGVYLGRFSSGDSMKLTVSVSLPIGMGNEYQDAEAYIDWIFYAKQYTSPDDGGGDDDSVKPDSVSNGNGHRVHLEFSDAQAFKGHIKGLSVAVKFLLNSGVEDQSDLLKEGNKC